MPTDPAYEAIVDAVVNQIADQADAHPKDSPAYLAYCDIASAILPGVQLQAARRAGLRPYVPVRR
jgi:hypothetical protein